MGERIVIDPVTRIEGHAKITIHLDDAGQVRDARFHVAEFRGFERFCVGRPFWDTTGAFALAIPQDLLPDAPEPGMFLYPRKSTPLYITQYAPYCTDAALRTSLLRQALLRQYDELTAIQPSELGGKPRYFPWQTWENGYYLLQK